LHASPENAQAHALDGFLWSARGRYERALASFETAIRLDPALGNAWLGRGLCRIRQGQIPAGSADLELAAALEPNRSVLRSYLGKAFDRLHETTNAERELRLAREFDDADPTAWFYSALLRRQQLRFNESVTDLEHSMALNGNRALYRSRLLLDQDRAVRGASLASIYQHVGLDAVSVREAARAVEDDYANYSAHLFLSDSFNALRDPTDFNLRYDTPWLNELLLANLLAPVGAGALSRTVSQHEYSRLFEGNRVGLTLDSEIRSDGQWRQLASQYATYGSTSYALDLDYRNYDGVRPNNDLSRIEWYSQIKQQISPRDSVLLFTEYRDYESGDNFQSYDPAVSGHPNLRLLGGRLENDQLFRNTDTFQPILTKSNATVTSAASLPFDVEHRIRFEIYTVELNQIAQAERQHLVAGGRFQAGTFQTLDQLTLSSGIRDTYRRFFADPPSLTDTRDDFERLSAYSYYTLEVLPCLRLTAGIAFDRLQYPTDFRDPPTFAGETTRTQFSPKAAAIWNPVPEFTLRGIYARGLGGVSFDQSIRLEPTQMAGFVQSFGSTIPESIVGGVAAPDALILGGAADVKLKSKTYLGVQVEQLRVDVDRQQGVFDFTGQLPILPGSSRQLLDFQESAVAATINQLVSTEWSLGGSYRFTQAELHAIFPAVAPVLASADRTERSDLHQSELFARYHHASGLFARAEGQWYHQDSSGYTPALASADFFQANFWLGWRITRQRGEISVGVLNFGNQDYRLNPLTIYAELPRQRTFVARLKASF